MSLSTINRLLLATTGLLAFAVLTLATSRAQTPSRHDLIAEQPGPSEPDESTFESERIDERQRREWIDRAREEVEILELTLGTKRAMYQKAERRAELYRTLHANSARLKTKGLASNAGLMRNEIAMLEANSQQAVRKADFAEAEIRFNQARRRLKRLEQGGQPGTGIVESISRDLFLLKEQVDRIEGRLDRMQDDALSIVEGPQAQP